MELAKDDSVTLDQLETVLRLSGRLAATIHEHASMAMLPGYIEEATPIPGLQKSLQDLSVAISNLSFSIKKHGIDFGPEASGDTALKEWALQLFFEYLHKRKR